MFFFFLTKVLFILSVSIFDYELQKNFLKVEKMSFLKLINFVFILTLISCSKEEGTIEQSASVVDKLKSVKILKNKDDKKSSTFNLVFEFNNKLNSVEAEFFKFNKFHVRIKIFFNLFQTILL